MFCPIFLSTIPPYIRPVISWVVTVRVHSASALTLLHQPSEGEHWRDGQGEQGRDRGKPCPTFQCQDSTKWVCGVSGRGEGLKVGGEVRLMVDGRSYRFWGSSESLLHKTLSRFSPTQLIFWKRGKTCKQWNNMQVQCKRKWHYR